MVTGFFILIACPPFFIQHTTSKKVIQWPLMLFTKFSPLQLFLFLKMNFKLKATVLILQNKFKQNPGSDWHGYRKILLESFSVMAKAQVLIYNSRRRKYSRRWLWTPPDKVNVLVFYSISPGNFGFHLVFCIYPSIWVVWY